MTIYDMGPSPWWTIFLKTNTRSKQNLEFYFPYANGLSPHNFKKYQGYFHLVSWILSYIYKVLIRAFIKSHHFTYYDKKPIRGIYLNILTLSKHDRQESMLQFKIGKFKIVFIDSWVSRYEALPKTKKHARIFIKCFCLIAYSCQDDL